MVILKLNIHVATVCHTYRKNNV